ncbi:MAG: SAM-dependent methyltransferase [Chlamydiia bacterium]|nr:SAM-dependent methyltransferase [Chlamydiia bacterium]
MSRILDQGCPFSQSQIWELQLLAYRAFGLEAWSKEGVPFYVTSNPWIAKQYALVVAGFLEDRDPKETVTIFDLGAGTGKFAYLFLKTFFEMVPAAPIRYVMTDTVAANRTFLQEHPKLKEFGDVIEVVDFHHAQKEPPVPFTGPCVVIANYFFNIIPQDYYKIEAGKLYEGQLVIETDWEDLTDPHLIQHLTTSFAYAPFDSKTISKEDLEILRGYEKELKNSHFFYPRPAFDVLRLFGEDLLLLSADQGLATLQQMEQAPPPRISVQGCLSLPVCYEAMARFFVQQGGISLLPSNPSTAFIPFAGILGECPFPKTARAYKEGIAAFEPIDYVNLITYILKECPQPSLDLLNTLLKLGMSDGVNFHTFFESIRKVLPTASQTAKESLKHHIQTAVDTFYPIAPDDGNFLLNLGVLLFEMGDRPAAKALFQQAQKWGADPQLVSKNINAC